jgi:hypothetical protein
MLVGVATKEFGVSTKDMYLRVDGVNEKQVVLRGGSPKEIIFLGRC